MPEQYLSEYVVFGIVQYFTKLAKL